MFVSALLDQYLALDATTLSDEQQRSLESVPLAPEDSAFAKRTTEASPQLLLLLLHETASPDLAARNRALSVLVRLAATNFGRADASSSAAQELAQLHHSLYNTSLTCPHLPTWRTAARRVMNAAAAICAQALAPPLFYETINRWRYKLTVCLHLSFISISISPDSFCLLVVNGCSNRYCLSRQHCASPRFQTCRIFSAASSQRLSCVPRCPSPPLWPPCGRLSPLLKTTAPTWSPSSSHVALKRGTFVKPLVRCSSLSTAAHPRGSLPHSSIASLATALSNSSATRAA